MQIIRGAKTMLKWHYWMPEATVRSYDFAQNMRIKILRHVFMGNHTLLPQTILVRVLACAIVAWAKAWQPWLKVDTSANVVAPCNSYTESGTVPVIDERWAL